MQWLNHDLPKAQQYKTLAVFMSDFVPHHFNNPDLPPALAVVEGQAVGFVHCTPYPNVLPPDLGRACRLHVVIDPAERGKGFSQPIFALATEYLHSLGWECVLAEIAPHNTALIRLFSRLGYHNLDETLPSGENSLRFVHCL
jgi:RimJ/RimL family protein N-acetyltransferase